MKVLVIGASGAIGRPLVPALVAAGHEVVGTTRSQEKIAAIEADGATGVVCDILEAASVTKVVADASPEIVINQATNLPARLDVRKSDAFEPTNRIRTEGTDNLVAALQGSGLRRLIAQSVAFAYAPVGGPIKAEEDPLRDDTEGPFARVASVVSSMEQKATSIDGIETIVLRYGFIYGPGTYYAADGSQAEDFHKRRYPMVGQGHGLTSFVHVDDAVAATVLALDRGDPGIYNIVDDDPAPANEWMIAYATALGAPPARRIPEFLAKLFVGRALVEAARESRGASNEKAREKLGWSLEHPSWRDGFAASLA